MDEPDPPTVMLRLRGRRGPVSALVLRPGTPGPSRRPVVALGQGQPETRALCRGTGRVVLALAPGEADAWDVVCWVAAHAAELGARPERFRADCHGQQNQPQRPPGNRTRVRPARPRPRPRHKFRHTAAG
jgi:hypothetical protein